MVYRPNPNDPFITPPPADDIPRTTDPLLPSDYDEAGPVSGTRVALYAVAVLALIGALFYGMSTTSQDTASSPPTTTTAQRPATPPAVRDVTPRPNTEPGMTTGSAPSQPAPADTKQ